MTDEKSPVRPAAPRVALYGVYWLHESLCVLEESEARTRAVEVAAVMAVTTLGELRQVAPTLRYTRLPADLDELDGEPDNTPWDCQSDGLGVQDGDWPQMPTSYILAGFTDDRAFVSKTILQEIIEVTGADVVSTVFNGDYLHIPLDTEHALVETLSRRGFAVVRDDDLVDSLGMQ